MQGWAQPRPRPSAHIIYKSSVGLHAKRPKSKQAPNIEFSARKKCDLKRGPRPRPLGQVQDQAQPSAHVILALVYKCGVGLQDLSGSTGLT